MRDELRRVHRLLCARFVDEAAFQAALGAGRGDISTVARYLALPVLKRPVLSIYFDRDFYFASNPDVFERMDDPLLHFLTEGFAALRSPHPLIDLNHIVREDPATLGEPPDLGALLDLLEYDLAAPSPYFDPGWYAESLAHTGPPRGQLRHFLTSGLTEGRRPNRWLDPEWYAAQHDDVPKDRYGALRHFLLVGDAQGRAAGPAFDGKLYRRRYVDVADAGVPPLRHYLSNGRREGRQLPVERLAPLPGPAAPGAAVPVAAAMPIDPAQAAIDYAAMRRLLDEEQQVRKDAIVPTAPVLAATAADGDLAALAFPAVAAPKRFDPDPGLRRVRAHARLPARDRRRPAAGAVRGGAGRRLLDRSGDGRARLGAQPGLCAPAARMSASCATATSPLRPAAANTCCC